MSKRLVDIVAATLGLAMLMPVLLLVACLIRLTSAGPVFFRQERMGRGFRPFRIYKFRTMVADASRRGVLLTAGDDPRVTRLGRFFRKTKIDELPQLINVLLGDMSLVGPRPEVPRYVEMFRDDYREILRVRPGMTDLASIEYRDEAAVLGQADDPEEQYVRVVLPRKIQLSKQYIRHASLRFDLLLVAKTIQSLITDRLVTQRPGCRPI